MHRDSRCRLRGGESGGESVAGRSRAGPGIGYSSSSSSSSSNSSSPSSSQSPSSSSPHSSSSSSSLGIIYTIHCLLSSSEKSLKILFFPESLPQAELDSSGLLVLYESFDYMFPVNEKHDESDCNTDKTNQQVLEGGYHCYR